MPLTPQQIYDRLQLLRDKPGMWPQAKYWTIQTIAFPQKYTKGGPLQPYFVKGGAKWPKVCDPLTDDLWDDSVCDNIVAHWSCPQKWMSALKRAKNKKVAEAMYKITGFVNQSGQQFYNRTFMAFHQSGSENPDLCYSHYHLLVGTDSPVKNSGAYQACNRAAIEPVKIFRQKCTDPVGYIIYCLYGNDRGQKFMGCNNEKLLNFVLTLKAAVEKMDTPMVMPEGLEPGEDDPESFQDYKEFEIIESDDEDDTPQPSTSGFKRKVVDLAEDDLVLVEEDTESSPPKKTRIPVDLETVSGTVAMNKFAVQKHFQTKENRAQAKIQADNTRMRLLIRYFKITHHDQVAREIADPKYSDGQRQDLEWLFSQVDKKSFATNLAVVQEEMRRSGAIDYSERELEELSPSCLESTVSDCQMYFDCCSPAHQRCIASTAILLAKQTTTKLGAVYIHGRPDTGKSYFFKEGISYIQNQVYNATTIGTFLFGELADTHTVRIFDDQNLVVDDMNILELWKQVLGRELGNVQAKYRNRCLMVPAPTIILNNKPFWTFVNVPGAAVHANAYHARIYHREYIDQKAPPCPVKILNRFWAIWILAAKSLNCKFTDKFSVVEEELFSEALQCFCFQPENQSQ